MKKMALSLFFIIALLACGEKLPDGILKKEKMIPILIDQHLAESFYTQRFALGIPDTNAIENLYLSVLKKHNVSRKQFEKSVYYYGKHPERYKAIYDEVLDRLNEMNIKAQQENPALKQQP